MMSTLGRTFRRWRAHLKHWSEHAPVAIWAPLAVASLLLIPGVLGILTGTVLLFPSLGPTVFLQARNPSAASASFRHVIGGHAIAVVVASAVVIALGARHTPEAFAMRELSQRRMWCAVVSVAVAALFELLFRVSHPPAAATTLLIALGAFAPTVHDITVIAVGVLLVAFTGEGLRRLRLPDPIQDVFRPIDPPG
jgi:hypothetical protein